MSLITRTGNGSTQRRQRITLLVTEQLTESNSSEDDSAYTLFSTTGALLQPLIAAIRVNNAELWMEVDTGASAAIISKSVYCKLWPMQPPLQPFTVKLRTNTGEELKVLGSLPAAVDYHSQRANLHLLVVAGSGPSLLGRDWLAKLRLDWQNLHQLQTSPKEH